MNRHERNSNEFLTWILLLLAAAAFFIISQLEIPINH